MTVEQLMPAMIELASIQHDMLRKMEMGEHASLPDLRMRTREVLAWLLERTSRPSLNTAQADLPSSKESPGLSHPG